MRTIGWYNLDNRLTGWCAMVTERKHVPIWLGLWHVWMAFVHKPVSPQVNVSSEAVDLRIIVGVHGCQANFLHVLMEYS